MSTKVRRYGPYRLRTVRVPLRNWQAGPVLYSPEAVAALLAPEVRCEDREVFWVLCLDNACRVRAISTMYYGTADAVNASIREILSIALIERAVRVIVAHAHPTGSLGPSPEDEKFTEALVRGGRTVEVKVDDHLILGLDHELNTVMWHSLSTGTHGHQSGYLRVAEAQAKS